MKKLTNQSPVLTLLFSLLYRSRWTLVIATAASIANGIASVLLITLINKTLNSTETNYHALAGYFILLTVVTISCRVLSGIFFARLSQGTMARMRKLISYRVACASFRQIEKLGASRAQSVITDDATNVSFLFFTLPNIVMQGSMILGCLAYLAWLSWPVFGLALTIVLSGSLGYCISGSRALASFRAAGKAQDRLFTHFSALFSGAKELKLHSIRSQNFLNHSLNSEIDAVGQHRTHAFSIYAFGVGWLLSLFYLFLGVIIFFPGVISGLDKMALAGYVIIFLFMLMPLDSLLNNIPTLNAARVSLNRIGKILSELNEQESIKGSFSVNAFGNATSLHLSGIKHSYYREKEGGIFQLGPVELELKRGEITFLIGGNGSGKTTLAKLLTGLYIPESGTITVDGYPIDDHNRIHYRQLFSAIFSDFHLFESLIGLNTGNGTLDEQANALLVKLHIDHKLKIENGYFSTQDLSQGQRKRLALVVAYLEDRPFYLFDEWAADQDPLFRKVFYEELLPELAARGKAVLAITHDERFFHLADHCIKLENGLLDINHFASDGQV